ncbi:putative signaling protein [Methanocella paludicola SANAE]|uniref:histidine kinase n=1 Tax=Methanocella paludicola (strain DSM 17711 / JCM 13418 / NBRC 101707 / SANAE) TaxID=304371 RepID=D1YYI5_METPS|nr:PAS domain S-box protein [Methanocella paludicola]BAI61507.1 putative signaling protein [Methanocella paludicola SANAE]
MDVNRKELSDIKDVLKDSPRGMTVTEISKAVGMNRHSVAKYLEVLVAAGHVDMKSFGPSKVYYLSQRVPLSAMLSFSSDLIVIIDKDLLIRNANDRFLETMGLIREKSINRNIENFLKPVSIASTIMSHIREALGGKDLTLDTSFTRDSEEVYYTVKFIPTVFDDGNTGVTLIMTDVTGHRRIENAIRDSERKFRDMISQSTEGIALCDENGVLIEYNESMVKLAGFPRENVIGKYVWDIPIFIKGYEQFTDRPPASLEENMKIILKTGKSPIKQNYNNFNIQRQDGTIISVMTNVFPIKTEKGYMLAAIVRDVTDLKKAEKAIYESEEKFRNLAETTTSGILILQEGRIVYANRGAENITGYSVKELLNKRMEDFIHPDYVRIVDDYWREYKNPLRTKKMSSVSREFKILKKNREERWIDGSIGMMTLNGRPALIKTFFDITGRKQMEEALKHERAELETRVKERTVELEAVNEALKAEVEQRRCSEESARKDRERYQNLIENINDIAWEMDAQARFTYVNPKIKDILGYGPEHYLGKVIMEFMPAEDVPKFSDGFSRIYARPRPYNLEHLRMFHKDGSIHSMEVNGMPFYDNKGAFQGFHGVTRDITLRKSMEELVDIMTYSMTHPDLAAFRVNADAEISYSNDAAGLLLGYTTRELNAIGMGDIDPAYSEAKWRGHWELLKQHRYEKSTGSYRSKDGKTIPVEVTENYAEFNGRGYSFFFIRPMIK